MRVSPANFNGSKPSASKLQIFLVFEVRSYQNVLVGSKWNLITIKSEATASLFKN